jgi:hypothetical protein
MTDANLTELICVLDRSGSMNAIVDDSIGGFNRMLDEQKQLPGQAHMTVVLFDNRYDVLYESRPVRDVPPLDSKTYQPRGATALLDAVGETIDRAGERFRNLPEEKRPGKVLFIILTDGHENASHRYSIDQVRSMIKQQTDEWNWQFIYLSADIDAFAHGRGLGISTRAAFRGSGQSIGSTYAVVSSAASQYRMSGGMSIQDSCTNIAEDGKVELNVDALGRTDGAIQSTTDSTADTGEQH